MDHVHDRTDDYTKYVSDTWNIMTSTNVDIIIGGPVVSKWVIKFNSLCTSDAIELGQHELR